MRSYLVTALLLLSAAFGTGAVAADQPSFAGSWKIDLGRSTELSPWKDYLLTITAEGDTFTLDRVLGWASRKYTDSMKVRLDHTETAKVVMWPDNRHLGAYIGDDHSKRVKAEWITPHRLLRLTTDLVLETQQGARDVRIFSDYELSADGKELKLTELRSTRNRPITYVFTRVAAQ